MQALFLFVKVLVRVLGAQNFERKIKFYLYEDFYFIQSNKRGTG